MVVFFQWFMIMTIILEAKLFFRDLQNTICRDTMKKMSKQDSKILSLPLKNEMPSNAVG